MKKILLFILCAGWSSQALPMLEPQSKDSVEAPLDFKIHQPALCEFTIKKLTRTLHNERKYCFELYGNAKNRDPHNEHPILRNFIITISLIPLSPQKIFVESFICANGYIFSDLHAEPANITIPLRYFSAPTTNLLDTCITQLLDLALFCERNESQFCCEGCNKALCYQDLVSNRITQQHYTSDQGQFYCEKCASVLQQCNNMSLINISKLSFDDYSHISSRIEYAQSHGGIW
ncbi:MAG: hypothetical protein WC365_02630 [Candidatus Babeliales bacterium]|jgi:hypothetical protein